MRSIFVQICSYRDLELLPTLRDLFSKSSGKYQINIGLVWQKDDYENIEEFNHHSQVKIINVDWTQSKGLGWARNLVQTLYNNEDYTLQLDSHHRFAQDWDSHLVNMFNKQLTISNKPILTAYACGYCPETNKLSTNIPCKIDPIDFKSSGTIAFNPNYIKDYQKLKNPIRARLMSGHYFFASGQHCLDYKYDPELYFAGDEINLTVRSYTLGYDLFHPHINLIWHYYGRHDKTKHWNDHKQWFETDNLSKKRIRQLLGNDEGVDLGIYGLGTQRTLHDYEIYSGIDFTNKRIQNCAIRGLEPPVRFDNATDYEKNFIKTTSIEINEWDRSSFLKLNNLDYFELDFYNLQQQIIYSTKSNHTLLDNETIKSTIINEHEPMKINISAFAPDRTLLHKFEKDLKTNISWS